MWVLLRVSSANLSKIQPGKIKPPDIAALKYWLGNRQPDKWREQPEEAGGGHDDALERLIKAQDAALADSK